jgi:hypothetical protein
MYNLMDINTKLFLEVFAILIAIIYILFSESKIIKKLKKNNSLN